MKKALKAIAFLVALSAVRMAWADDPLKVAPDMYKLVFENERVRVMEVTFNPGQKIAKHSHPDHYIYVVEPGTLTISKPDGSTTVAQLTTGQVIWIPAETHWAENTGATKVRLLVNELKEPAPKAKAKPKAK